MDDIKKRRKFDTKVQYLQYKVLREVARGAWNGDLLEKITDIPKTIIPGNVPTMRCCVYKERAIIPSASSSLWAATAPTPTS